MLIPLTTPACCPAAVHAHLQASAQAMMNLTTPGARTADPAGAGCWNEIRHCVACQGTLTYQGGGVSRRWVYGVTDPDSAATIYANTLEDVLDELETHGLSISTVSRYVFGSNDHQALTTGEVFWLRYAAEAAVAR